MQITYLNGRQAELAAIELCEMPNGDQIATIEILDVADIYNGLIGAGMNVDAYPYGIVLISPDGCHVSVATSEDEASFLAGKMAKQKRDLATN